MTTTTTGYVINRQKFNITFPTTPAHLPVDPEHFFAQLLIAA